MATLRLFAGLREAAGIDRVEFEENSVGEVLDAAAEKFGRRFAAGLASARVWLNGDEADRADSVGPGDEIALIPPVSGGAGSMSGAQPGLDALIPLAVAGALVAANLATGNSWFVAVLVGAAALWAADVAAASSHRSRDLPLVPVLVTILATMATVHVMGGSGLALGLVASVVVSMSWAVASDSSRPLQVLAPSVVMSFMTGAAVGSLMLARTGFDPGSRVVGVYLAVVVASAALGAAIERYPQIPLSDPISGTALSAIVVAVVAAAIWELELVAFLLTGLALTFALLAGRGFGSMLRTGRVSLTDRPPGALAVLDGAVLAAAVFFPILRLVFV